MLIWIETQKEATEKTHLEPQGKEELGRIVEKQWSMGSTHLCKTYYVLESGIMKVNNTVSPSLQGSYSNYN